MMAATTYPPIPDAINLLNLPDEIQNASSLVLYKLATRSDSSGEIKLKEDGSIKWDKIPVDRNGANGSYNDKNIYRSLDDIVELLAVESTKEVDKRRFHGAAIALKNCDVDNFLAIDIDNCIDAEGNLNEVARDLVDNIEGYVEKSISGTGIHILTKAENINGNPKKKEYGVELFRDNLFLTLSGDVLEGRDSFPNAPVDVSALNRYLAPTEAKNKLVVPSFDVAAKRDYSLTVDVARKILMEELEPESARDFWMEVGMALHFQFEGSEEALELWADYSQREGAGDLASEQDFRKQWNSLKLNHPNPVTFASIIGRVRKATLVSEGQQFGDMYNGEVFAEMFRGQFLFVRAKGTSGLWLKFDGVVWSWCGAGEEEIAAKLAAKEIIGRAGESIKALHIGSHNLRPSQDVRPILNNARAIRDVNKQQSMLRSAASEPGMYAGLFDLDPDPFLVACLNGAINLRTGELIEAAPEMLLTQQIQANFNPEAQCPVWERFVHETFLGNAEVISYFQKILGYFLTADVHEEKWWIWLGEGSNGKSVVANFLTFVMNDLVGTANSSLLMYRDMDSGNTNDIAATQGKRLVLVNESKVGKTLDEGVIKVLVSADKINARFLYKEAVPFYPSGKIVLLTNNLPKIVDETNGAWRRTVLMKFENNVSEENQDLQLYNKLIKEKDGILAWMVRGCLLYQQEGIKNLPEKIAFDTREYRFENDKMRGFLEECCDLTDTEIKTAESDVYRRFVSWCREAGLQPFNKNRFTRDLLKSGVTQSTYLGHDKKQIRAYKGIKPHKDSDWFM